MKSLSHARLLATPRTAAYQAPPSMGFSGKSTGVGCHFLFQRIFPIQGSNPGLPHCRQLHCRLYHLSHQGNPKQSRNSFPQQILPFAELIYFSRSALPSQSSHLQAGDLVHCICCSHHLEYSSPTSSPGSSYPSSKTRMSVISSMRPFLTPLEINCVNTVYSYF